MVGALGIGPRIAPTPRVYVTITLCPEENYFLFANALIHLAQDSTFLPEGKRTHCKLGFCFLLIVGLYFPRSLILRQTRVYFFLQIVHCFIYF
jgi:hypothetical protein